MSDTFDFSVFDEFLPKEKTQENCCDKMDIIEDKVLLCRNCGVIRDKFVSSDAEYRLFSGDNGTNLDSVRCSGNTNNHIEYSLGTIIHDSGKKKSFYNRSRYYTQKSYRQKIVFELSQVFNGLVKLGISQNIINNSISLFLDVLGIEENQKNRNNKKVVKGQNRKGLMGVCLHQSYLEIGITRNIDEISKILEISSKKMNHAYENYIKLKSENLTFQISGISNLEMIENYNNQLNLSFKMYKFISIIYSVIETNGFLITNMRPKSIILGLFYFVLMEFQNKDGLDKLTSGTIKISKHTLNKVYQMLLLNKRIIFQETKKKLIYKIFSN